MQESSLKDEIKQGTLVTHQRRGPAPSVGNSTSSGGGSNSNSSNTGGSSGSGGSAKKGWLVGELESGMMCVLWMCALYAWYDMKKQLLVPSVCLFTI